MHYCELLGSHLIRVTVFHLILWGFEKTHLPFRTVVRSEPDNVLLAFGKWKLAYSHSFNTLCMPLFAR